MEVRGVATLTPKIVKESWTQSVLRCTAGPYIPCIVPVFPFHTESQIYDTMYYFVVVDCFVALVILCSSPHD